MCTLAAQYCLAQRWVACDGGASANARARAMPCRWRTGLPLDASCGSTCLLERVLARPASDVHAAASCLRRLQGHVRHLAQVEPTLVWRLRVLWSGIVGRGSLQTRPSLCATPRVCIDRRRGETTPRYQCDTRTLGRLQASAAGAVCPAQGPAVCCRQRLRLLSINPNHTTLAAARGAPTGTALS